MSVATRNLFDLLAEPDESVPMVKKNAVTDKKNAVEKKKAEKPIPLGKVKEEHHPDKNPRHRKPVHGREYDRRSGTGIKKEGAKKTYMGKGNWGAAGDVGSEKEKIVQKEEAPVTADENTAPLEEEKEEENLKTLDQYLSEKVSNLKVNKTVRKANEGSDESQWKNAVVLVKEDEDLVVGKVKGGSKKPKEKSAKVTLDIEQRFSEKSEFRKFDGKGKKNDNYKKGPKQVALNVTDAVAFPSLGSK